MRGIALCCGFNDYEGVPLTTAVNDATSIHSTLMANRMYSQDPALMRASKALVHKAATADDVLTALDDAASRAAEFVWFSFSGHGLIIDGELHLLLPLWMSTQSRKYAIGATALETVLRRNRHKYCVAVLDACQTGGFGAHVERDAQPVRGEELLSKAGVVVLSACAPHQRASDGDAAKGLINGLFTHCLLTQLRSRQQDSTTLSVLRLFFDTASLMRDEARDHSWPVQRPMLYANGLSEDFPVLVGDRPAPLDTVEDGLSRELLDIPTKLRDELRQIADNAVTIKRNGYIGLGAAERQMARLAGDFFQWAQGHYRVDEFSANVREAYSNAKTMIVACTTPTYFDDWCDNGGGVGLLYANNDFIRRGGKVIRFFFVPEDNFRERYPQLTNIVRDHVQKGVDAYVVNIDGYGKNWAKETFPRKEFKIDDLEFAFVDGKLLLQTIFAASGMTIDVDQRPQSCRLRYTDWLKPFLTSRPHEIFRPKLNDGNPDELIWPPAMDERQVETLRMEIETTILGGPAGGRPRSPR